MPAAAPPGTVIGIGLAGNDASVTSVNPAAVAAADQVMLYLSGVPVVAVYGRLALVAPLHTVGNVPNVIVGEGLTVTDKVWAALVPQALPAVTETLPEVAVPQLTVIEVVPWPVLTVAPAGTVHVYVVAPLTAEIEYATPLAPAQTEELPVIGPGVAGVAVETVTASDEVGLVPLQDELLADTVTLPPVLPHVTVIEVVPWPAVIVAPDGTVHV
jgi:hypothetical protein